MSRAEGTQGPTVLLVDDSSAVRAALAKGLRAQGLQVVGGAADPYMARDLIFKLQPDVLTLDLQMPHMDGLSFLAKLMAYKPMPVVVLSSLTSTHRELAVQAMELGAVEVFPKPDGRAPVQAMADLAQALRRAARSHPRKSELPSLSLRSSQGLDLDRVVAVGASTGGTSAIHTLLSSLPSPFPPILIVQHMPAGFTETFARRLNRSGKLLVSEARDGDRLAVNRALLAPGGQHMRLERGSDGRLRVHCAPGAPVNHVAPSVDVLFRSVAETLGARAVGVLLTGMGRDGAEGLLAMRQRGALTLAQDEASSVIWGMPGEAHKLGAAEALVPLSLMGGRLAGLLQASPVVC
jgi:two-component system chemotaxis response regulator CheB